MRDLSTIDYNKDFIIVNNSHQSQIHIRAGLSQNDRDKGAVPAPNMRAHSIKLIHATRKQADESQFTSPN
jgi:hypothetical protein